MIIHAFKGYGHLKKTKDGKYIAIVPKKIEVYESSNFKKVAQFGDMRHPDYIAFSSDSKFMAVENYSGLINLYDLAEMSYLKSFQPSEQRGNNILFSPDDENIIFNDWDGNLFMINISSGKIETIRQYEGFSLSSLNYDGHKNMFYMIARQRENVEDKTYEPEKYYNILIEWQYPFVVSSLRERKIRHNMTKVQYNPMHDGYIAIHDEDLVVLNSDLEVIKARKLNSPYHIRTTLDWSTDGELILLTNNSTVELIDFDSFNIINTFEFEVPYYAEFIREDDCTTFSCGTFHKTYYIDLQKVEKSENPIVIA